MAQDVDPQANYKCLRTPEDGSIYYGEVAYIRKANGQIVKIGTPAYDAEVKPLSAEDRVASFEMVRHGHGLQLFSGKPNEDNVITKYEGHWMRNKRHGEGIAVFADGSTYKGSFLRNVLDGQGIYTWAKGHEYKGAFRDGQMDGMGLFTHKDGTEMNGKFKRNQYDNVSE